MIWQRTLLGAVSAALLVSCLLTTGPWVEASPWRVRLWAPLRTDGIENCPKDCCPDNYCIKPAPCPVSPCLGCDDYCPKPNPCAIFNCRWLCDDYCQKPIPPLCCPPCGPLDKCGPGNWCTPLNAIPVTPPAATQEQQMQLLPKSELSPGTTPLMSVPAMPTTPGPTPAPVLPPTPPRGPGPLILPQR